MISVAVSEFAELRVAGKPAKEYRIFFYDPKSRIDHSLVGMFRLTSFAPSTWYVNHEKLLLRFLKYWRTLQLGLDIKIRGKIYEKIRLDTLKNIGYTEKSSTSDFDVYNSYSIMDHEVRFGPLHLPPPERLVHIHDQEGGSTGYCRLKHLKDVADYIRILQEPGGLANFCILPPKGDMKVNHPTANT